MPVGHGFLLSAGCGLENGPSSAIPPPNTTTIRSRPTSSRAADRSNGTVTIVHYDLWHRAMPNLSITTLHGKVSLHAHERTRRPAWSSAGQGWTHAPNGPPDALCHSKGRGWAVRWTASGRRSTAALRPFTESVRIPLEAPMPWPSGRRRRATCYAARAEAAHRKATWEAHTNEPLDALFALSAAGAIGPAPLGPAVDTDCRCALPQPTRWVIWGRPWEQLLVSAPSATARPALPRPSAIWGPMDQKPCPHCPSD